MKSHITRLAVLMLAGATVFVSFAPSAQAEHERRSDNQWNRGPSRWEPENRWESREHRSYFYFDMARGIRNSHISAFKPFYRNSGRIGLIQKIDIRTRRVLATYVYDRARDGWRDARPADFRAARRWNGGGRAWDRDRDDRVGYNGGW